MALVTREEVVNLFQQNPSVQQIDVHIRPGDFGVTIIGERVAAGGNGKSIEEAVDLAFQAYSLQSSPTVVIDGVVLAPQPLVVSEWVTDEQEEVQ